MDTGVVSGTLQPAPGRGARQCAGGRRQSAVHPVGLRRRRAVCGVSAPRRCQRIAVVALPCIWPYGAR